MNREDKTPYDVVGECSWCGKSIGDKDELFALGAKMRPGVDISAKAGGPLAFDVLIGGRRLYAFVPTPDSEAKKHGHDLLFVTCSRQCGEKLKARLNEETTLGDMIENLDGF